MRWRIVVIASLLVCAAALVCGKFLSRAPEQDAQAPRLENQQGRNEEKPSYYLMVFASQAGNEARSSHTFATFVKATREGSSEDDGKLEEHTISWLPRSLDIVIVRRWAEPGVNVDLQATRQWAESMGARVTMWGPFEIEKELYDRGLAQIARLQSGAVRYKAIDEKFRPDASNCIHAVSDVDTGNGFLHVGKVWGEPASAQVVDHLRRWMIEPEKTHPWLAKKLGLEDYLRSQPTAGPGAED
ncbi:MAG TPA: hypothetical protein VKI65_15435 [Gemmataceae bacterium]|nr:hypothetical protein [Gemmataceae bacterium]